MTHGRALFLTALLVVSVFSGTVTIGAVTAADVDRGDSSPAGYGGWDTTAGEGDVGDGAVVYRGEEDITLVDNGEGPGGPGDEVDPVELERTGSGTTLQVPIPEDAETGPYSTDGESFDDDNFGVRVREPEIGDFDINNDDGVDKWYSTLSQDNEDAEVAVDYNFVDAEDLEVTVRQNGIDVTDEFIEGPQSLHPEDVGDPDYDVVFNITDLETVERGKYRIVVQGVDDLDQPSASASTTVTVGDIDENASIAFDSSETPQGEVAFFSVDSEAKTHLVTLPRDSYRGDGITVGEAAGIFRDDFDVEERGIVTEDAIERDGDPSNAHTLDELEDAGIDGEPVGQFEAARDTDILYSYAVLETSGDGSMRTDHLADTSIDVSLHEANDNLVDDEELVDPGESPGDPVAVYGVADSDVATVTVTAGTLSLDTPRSPYVIGDAIPINGTASANLDDVVVYARDDADWERVTGRIGVGPEDRFEQTEFDLVEESATDIFAIRGIYMVGVIAADDADVDGDGTVDDTVETGAFSQGVSTSRPLRVIDQNFSADFAAVDGQVAVEDATVSVTGTAPGRERVDVVLVGTRGTLQHESLPVDDDGTFEATDLDIETGLLDQGSVTAYALSPGPDGIYGSGTQTAGNLAAVDGIPPEDAAGGSSAQLRDRIRANTVNATGSDDLMITSEFRLTDGLSTIESVHPVGAPGAGTVGSGETIAVTGTTNRVPGDSTIVVELLSESGQSVAAGSTDRWDRDGQWNVSLAVDSIEPGNYTVRADDGLVSDRQPVVVVGERETPTPTTEPDGDVTPTAFPTPGASEPTETPTPTPAPTPAPTATPAAEPAGQGGPGFGVVVGVVGVLVAALLLVRRG
jgi:major cell surface glycoprotein (TIGR04216 family)